MEVFFSCFTVVYLLFSVLFGQDKFIEEKRKRNGFDAGILGGAWVTGFGWFDDDGRSEWTRRRKQHPAVEFADNRFDRGYGDGGLE